MPTRLLLHTRFGVELVDLHAQATMMRIDSDWDLVDVCVDPSTPHLVVLGTCTDATKAPPPYSSDALQLGAGS